MLSERQYKSEEVLFQSGLKGHFLCQLLPIVVYFGESMFRRPRMEDFRPCWCVAHRGDGSKGGCASNCRPQPSLWPDAVRGGWRDQRRSLHRTRHTPNPIRGIGMPGAKGLCYQYHEAGVKVWNCNLDHQWTWDKPLAWQVMASICKYASGWGKWWETAGFLG